MAFKFSVPTHTTFFDGYLDAVGRQHTNEQRLCALTIRASAAGTPLEGLAVSNATPVENMVREFQSDIAGFLNADPKQRVVFYLIDYFCWYKEFSTRCDCHRVRVQGEGITDEQIGFRLNVNDEHDVVFFGYWRDNAAMPNKSLERTREG
jgi:hypothetical protein